MQVTFFGACESLTPTPFVLVWKPLSPKNMERASVVSFYIGLGFVCTRESHSRFYFFDATEVATFRTHDRAYRPLERTPLALLFTSNKKLELIGYSAISYYSRLRESRQGYIFFKDVMNVDFHMDERSSQLIMVAENEKMLPAIAVFGQYLAHMKTWVLHNNYFNECVSEMRIYWVLPIPSTWGEAAKQMMKDAAIMVDLKNEQYEFGIIPESSAVVLYVLEEALSQPCTGPFSKWSQLTQLVVMCDRSSVDVIVQNITRGMDDIILMKVLCDRRLNCGTDEYSDEILKFFQKICDLSSENVTTIKQKYWSKMFEGMWDDQWSKRDDQPVFILIPLGMRRYIREVTGKSMKDLIDQYNGHEVEWVDEEDALVIQKSILHSICTPVINRISKQIEGILELPECNSVTHAACICDAFIYNHSHFYEKLILHRPYVDVRNIQDPISTVIAKGAAVYGTLHDKIKIIDTPEYTLKQENLRLKQEIVEMNHQLGYLMKANELLEQQNQQLDQQSRELTQQNQELDQQSRELRQQNQELDQQSRELRQQNQELDQQLTQSKQEYESSWVVQANEIILSTDELGRGAYGLVKKATFRGCKVAVKCLHSIVLSDYNQHIFNREMNMAARCRHPNLVQFIGATRERNPKIVTELMHTSLYQLLHDKQLKSDQIIPILYGVACGLNYLHRSTPAIIHRDVSSPNILLNPLPSDQWLAKVSDFGSSNFVHASHSRQPGNQCYAAPEALDPSKGLQTVALDVFSYGVLTHELCTREQPDGTLTASTLKTAVWKPPEKHLATLIAGCIAIEIDKRKNMDFVMVELNRVSVL